MADKIRPLPPAVQKQIYYYMNEIKKFDPEIITKTEEWCMYFENKFNVPLFYFTFTEPLSFRIKEHSEDNTYDFITEDSPRNRKVILDHIRTLIFESYMNSNGLIAKMSSNMRSYLLRTLDKNDINRYDDNDDSFVAYIKDIEIFRITETKDPEHKFQITIPQNVFRTNPEEIPNTLLFESENYREITEHIYASCSFYSNYEYKKVIMELNKIRNFINITYGAENVSELNSNVNVILSAGFTKVVQIEEKQNGKLYMSYHLSKDFIEKEWNNTNLIKLFALMDDKFYIEGKKLIDSFTDDQVVLLANFSGDLLDYNPEIITEYPERIIQFKTPYNLENPFAKISRNDKLELSIFINGRTIDFKLDNQDQMIDLANSYLVATDPRIAITRREIERLRELEDYTDESLEEAKKLIDEFATYPDLLRERNEYIKIELGDLVTAIENALEEKRRAEASMSITSEAYQKLAEKLTSLLDRIDALEVRVRFLEDKNEQLEEELQKATKKH